MSELKRYSSSTEQGPYLVCNEDNVYVNITNNLFGIFDGIGGSGIGDQVVKKVIDCIDTFYTKITDDPEATLPFYYSSQYLIEGNALINALYKANEEVEEFNKLRTLNQKGAASFIIAAMSENIMSFVYAGNCKCFIFREGNLTEFIHPDNCTINYGFNSQFMTAPSNAMGLFEKFNFKIKEFKIKKNDQVIFLTDGAYSRVSKKELLYLLNKNSLSNKERIDEIYKLSNLRGNLDNQSALFIQY